MERKQTFNEVAKEYDRYRPDYPDRLFADILEFAPIGAGDAILEIGCGTGQATKGFVDRGYGQLTCIELGQNLAELAREKFKNTPSVTVIQSPFETWQSDRNDFKLAISGTAFHFIQPQAFGYRKVYDLLDPDGSIAFFWTVHVPSFDGVFSRIRDSYRKHAPRLDDSNHPSIEQIIDERSALTVKDGLFKQLEVKRYEWSEAYTADRFIALLNTHSGHRLLPDEVRLRLFDEIRETIERHGGGTVNRPQAVALYLARKKA